MFTPHPPTASAAGGHTAPSVPKALQACPVRRLAQHRGRQYDRRPLTQRQRFLRGRGWCAVPAVNGVAGDDPGVVPLVALVVCDALLVLVPCVNIELIIMIPTQKWKMFYLLHQHVTKRRRIMFALHCVF